MKRKTITTIVYIIALITLDSCGHKMMKYVNFESKDYKMYFIDPFYQMTEFDECDFIKQHKNFYIDDPDFLMTFKDELIKDKTDKIASRCIYLVQIIQDSSIMFGAFLDIKNGIMNTKNGIQFDVENFSNHKDKFKKLESFEVNCFSIKNSKILIEKLHKQGGFMTSVDDLKEYLDSYNGSMKLSVAPGFIKQNDSWSKKQKSIQKKFAKVEEILVYSYSSDGEDSDEIGILCKNDISEQLPEGFHIIGQYSDSINFPFTVYDLTESEIKRIANENNINTFKIKDLNK